MDIEKCSLLSVNRAELGTQLCVSLVKVFIGAKNIAFYGTNGRRAT